MMERGKDAGAGVPVDDFLDGCMQMKGHAKSIDVVCLLSESRHLISSLAQVAHAAESEFETIRMVFRKMGYPVPSKATQFSGQH